MQISFQRPCTASLSRCPYATSFHFHFYYFNNFLNGIQHDLRINLFQANVPRLFCKHPSPHADTQNIMTSYPLANIHHHHYHFQETVLCTQWRNIAGAPVTRIKSRIALKCMYTSKPYFLKVIPYTKKRLEIRTRLVITRIHSII